MIRLPRMAHGVLGLRVSVALGHRVKDVLAENRLTRARAADDAPARVYVLDGLLDRRVLPDNVVGLIAAGEPNGSGTLDDRRGSSQRLRVRTRRDQQRSHGVVRREPVDIAVVVVIAR